VAARGYTTAAKVAGYLGVTLSTEQSAQCAALIPSVEKFIDGRLGRALMVSAVATERHALVGPRVFLRHTPATTITSVTGVTTDGTATTLATDRYRLLDPERGLLYLDDWGAYDYVTVAYACDATLPDDIGLAATMLAAAWLQPALRPGTEGVESYRLPDLEVRFVRERDGAGRPVPRTVSDILDGYTWEVVG
jgi:hypothetical protein